MPPTHDVGSVQLQGLLFARVKSHPRHTHLRESLSWNLGIHGTPCRRCLEGSGSTKALLTRLLNCLGCLPQQEGWPLDGPAEDGQSAQATRPFDAETCAGEPWCGPRVIPDVLRACALSLWPREDRGVVFRVQSMKTPEECFGFQSRLIARGPFWTYLAGVWYANRWPY